MCALHEASFTPQSLHGGNEYELLILQLLLFRHAGKAGAFAPTGFNYLELALKLSSALGCDVFHSLAPVVRLFKGNALS